MADEFDPAEFEASKPKNEFNPNEFEKFKSENTDVVPDMAKGFGTGLVRGAIGLAGLPGDVSNLIGKGVNWAADKIGLPPAPPGSQPDPTGFTSEALTNKLESVTGPLYKPKTTLGKYANSVGEFVPGIVGGPEGLASRALTRVIAPAVASEAAGQATEGTKAEPFARIAAAVATHGASQGVRSALGLGEKPAIPTREQLHDVSSSQYNNVKGYGIEIHPNSVSNLADSILSDLHNDGWRERNIPKSWGAIEELKNPAGQNSTISDIDSVRKVLLRTGVDPAEREASRRAIAGIDQYLGTLDQRPHHIVVNPQFADRAGRELRDAQGNWSAMRSVDSLLSKIDNANLVTSSTYTGTNADNALRRNIRQFLTNPKLKRQLSPLEQEQARHIVDGTLTGNLARSMGRPLRFLLGTVAGFHAAGIPGMVATHAAGHLLSHYGAMLTRREVDKLNKMAATDSPLFRSGALPPENTLSGVGDYARTGALAEQPQRATGGAVKGLKEGMSSVQSRKASHYNPTRGIKEHNCGICRYFVEKNKCSLVGGFISKAGGCSWFQPKPNNRAQGGRTNFYDGGDPELSDTDQAQDAAEAAAARVRAPYVQANSRVSGLPDVGTAIGNRLINSIMAGPNLMGQVAHGEIDPNSEEGIQRATDVAANTMGYGMMGAGKGLGMFGGRPTYSAAGEAVRNAKAQVMQPNQWLGYLKNQPGVKAQELEHVGLEPWLKEKSGPVSKDELDQFVQSKQPEINEVKYGQTDWDKIQPYEDKLAGINSERVFAMRGGDKERYNDLTNQKREIEKQIQSMHNPAPRYQEYQLPGGENYGETLLTLPDTRMPGPKTFDQWAKQNRLQDGAQARREYSQWRENNLNVVSGENNYKSSHWQEPNVLLHVRHNDRDIPGQGKSLHIEEIQSDWHQAGRKQGYDIPVDPSKYEITGNGPWVIRNKDTGDYVHDFNNKTHAEGYLKDIQKGLILPWKKEGLVPDAPFKNTWPDLALKRMLHRAATEKNADGSYKYNSMSWTPGQAQADRYDLSKQVKRVYYMPETQTLRAKGYNGETVIDKTVPKEKLSDYIGKDVAQKLLDQPLKEVWRDSKGSINGHDLQGLDLKVGGEGMKQFYDNMLPDKVNALTKKFGTKAERYQIPFPKDGVKGRPRESTTSLMRRANQLGDPIWHLPITPELRNAAERGFPTFQHGGRVSTNRASGGRVTINPKVDRAHDIKWMSILSNDGKTFYRDRSLNRFIKNNGKILDIEKPLMEHEKAEYTEMRKEIESFKKEHGREPNDKERQKIYLSAHKNHGEVAEKKWIESNGFSWPQWEAWCRGELSRIEKKKTTKNPPSQDVALFPHGQNLGTTLRADGGRVQNFDDGGAALEPSAADPYSGVMSMPDQSQVADPLKKLLGLDGEERYQTWPERTIKGAGSTLNKGIDLATGFVSGIPDMIEDIPNVAKRVATAPRDALSGKLQVNDPETGMPTPEAMLRGNEFAGAVMGTAFPFAEKGALGTAGGRLGTYYPAEKGEGITKQIFKAAGPKADELKSSGVATPDYHELNPEGAEHFHNAFSEAKEANLHGAAVHIYNPQDYAKTRMFLTPDSKAGFALKGDDIVSVFKHPDKKDSPNITQSMLDLATSQGGKRLDAFDTTLPNLYSKSGFRAVSRLPWNDEYAPANWNYGNFSKFNEGRPDVVYMVHDPKGSKAYKPGEGKMVSDPDEAVRLQDEAISGAKPEDYEPIQGAPTSLTIPGQGKVSVGPFFTARQAAREYMEESGIPYTPPKTYAKVDLNRAKKIADEFEKMPHDLDDPAVISAYEAMARETMAQWDKIKKTGFKSDFITDKDPYDASPRMAIEDIKNNNHMWVYPTDNGYGPHGVPVEEVAKNPMLRDSGEVISGKPARINDIFRIVHDYFGHAKDGFGFRADGEENAWRSHAAMYSPEARKAMTVSTRGQNSWLNYGPYGEKNRTAKTEDTRFADQKIGLLPDWVTEEGRRDPGVDISHPDWIDTRLPTGKKVSEPEGNRIVDLENMKRSPDLYEHNVGLVRDYPNMPTSTNKLSTDQAAEHFVNQVKDNLLFLHDQVPPEVRNRSKLWYEGARKIVDKWSKEFGVKDSTVSGVMAALSPQMDWFKNVSLARRVLDINKNISDMPLTSEMESTFKNIPALAKNKPLFNLIKGKSLSDIDQMTKLPVEERAVLKAMWTRLYDEAHHSKDYRVVTPEGGFGDKATTSKGNQEKIAWGSLPMVAKSIRAIETDDGRKSMNTLMGMKHKIRNFYNNILVPNSNKGDVTIDTHAVSAGLLRPLAGKDLEVSHNFRSYAGKGLPNSKGSSTTGIQGTYPLYAEAYRRAAADRNILPREMQSITWEAIRGLFPEDMKGDKLSKAADDIWNEYKTGKASLDETRQKILEAGGGIRNPKWYRPADELNAASRGSSDQGELPEPSLYGPATQAPGGGGRPTAKPKVGGRGFYPKRESVDERNYLAGNAVDDAFSKAGMPILKPGPTRDKVIDLVGRRGDDPLDVYERVIMEEGNQEPKPSPKQPKITKKIQPTSDDVPFARGGAVNRADGGWIDNNNEEDDPNIMDARYDAWAHNDPDAGINNILLQRAFGGRINHNPSESQKQAGNYKKGHIRLHGLDISIENAKGSTRRGVSKDGVKWKSTLPNHYGYIKKSKGADEDQIDVYVGPNHNSNKIFVVNQKDADNGSFDEHKSYVGFSNIAQVKNSFLRAFSDGKGKKRMGHITEMTVPEFKSFIEAETDRNTTYSKP